MTEVRTRTSRETLNRDRVLRAAMTLADEQGIDQVTMRKLGQSLGVEAMSLYNHVANKDDLFAGMVDLVLGEIEIPAADGEWTDSIRRSAISIRQALKRHPWACGLMMSRAGFRPLRLQYMDALLGRLREAGFSADTTYHAYHLLDSHILGFTLWESGYAAGAEDFEKSVEARGSAAEFSRQLRLAGHPYLAEHAEQHVARAGRSFGANERGAFELGLDLILEGLCRQLPFEASEVRATAAT
jgi:AcrR family transcriptional regulator